MPAPEISVRDGTSDRPTTTIVTLLVVVPGAVRSNQAGYGAMPVAVRIEPACFTRRNRGEISTARIDGIAPTRLDT